MTDTGWQREVAALWARFDEDTEEEFLAAMERLVAQRLADDPVALYEHGSAYDSIGREEPAVAKYRRALAGGLADRAGSAPHPLQPVARGIREGAGRAGR